MAIKQPIVAEIAYRTWCIDEFGMDAQFLLEGKEKALLIDTGTGFFDLPSLVRELTDKPLIVALTHGHVDHAGGIHMFDQIYIHPDDQEMAKSVTIKGREDYLETMMSISEGIYDLTPDMIIKKDNEPEMLELKEGMVFHLGDRDVQVYETPGHTPGGISFLDLQSRILFSGDACNPNTLLALGSLDDPEGPPRPKSSVSDLLYTAKKLDSLSSLYDRHYNGHIGYAAMVSVMPMAEGLVKDAIEVCEGLLSGSITGVPAPPGGFGGDCLVAKGKLMQVEYYPSQVK